MKMDWSLCKNILCIRPDNLGDLLMSGPAIRALKETFHCKITVLTSSMAVGITKCMDVVDDVIIYDFPWVKTEEESNSGKFLLAIEDLKSRHFDAAVIFTVYSQNPLPTVMMAYLANIPRRLAYCRENPYQLLTHWVPEKEPYSFIRHQVRRDLDLVGSVGAGTGNKRLQIKYTPAARAAVLEKLEKAGLDLNKPWVILHAGVSEKKREFPEHQWISAGKKLIKELQVQVLLTGTKNEKKITENLQEQIGAGAVSFAGASSLEEFIALVDYARLVISVNTATVHIAAATKTPVIVLYALTNPQHLPWKATGKALFFDVPEKMRSKNEVVQYVHKNCLRAASHATPEDILMAASGLLNDDAITQVMPEMAPLTMPFSSVETVSLKTSS
jgi:lipopolysaccharide heptosyltransferase II